MGKSTQPYFVFSNNEAEQRRQLETNELMEQYRKFRGADPNPQALLRRRGLIE